MKLLDWAALVGAAAWIPQVIGWVARRLTVPRVRLVPADAPEIGFTSYGAILNLPCAISAERKDAVIERMACTLQHAKGQGILLTWSTLNETFSQVRSSEGQTAEYTKNQSAIALKVGTTLLAEKLIGFHNIAFQKQVRALQAVAAERLAVFRETAEPSPENSLLKSKEYAELVSLWEREFPWQEGRYTVTIGIHIVGVSKPTERVLHVSLSALDIKRLRANLVEVARYQRELVQPPTEALKYAWNWVYPQFER